MKNTFKDKKEIDLKKLLTEKEAELGQFRFGSSGAKATNVRLGRNVRRDIARLKTLLNNSK